MKPTKKIVLFIVEGITDATALANTLDNLNQDEKILFQIVNSDITADYSSNTTNIIEKIYEQVRKFMQEGHFTKKDILKIIHLVDTDGAYINKNEVKYNEIKNLEYCADHIETQNVDAIIERNIKKSSILNRISTTNSIGQIPYTVYYFSTNMEHVLHNIQNALKSEKMKLAEKFDDQYSEDSLAFINFITNDAIAVKLSYEESWNFIKKDNNSLKRYTNFNLFFE